MIGSVGHALYQTAWVFYALGPELVICMVLGYVAAVKSRGSRLNWLAAGFLAAVVPVAGALLMAWLLWRSTSTSRRGEQPS
jgi:hypothetical protein